MIKVGDKLKCKSDIVIDNYYVIHELFTEGEYYTISESLPNGDFKILNNIKNYSYLNEYSIKRKFYLPDELRKKKLNTIL